MTGARRTGWARLRRIPRGVARRLRTAHRRRSARATVRAEERAASAELSPLRGLESLLPVGPDRLVVIVAPVSLRGRLAVWLAPFAGDRVHLIAARAVPEWHLEERDVTFHAGETLDQISWQIRLTGAPDVLVNLLPVSLSEHDAMWHRLFCYLRSGAAYVVGQEHDERGAFRAELSSWVRYITSAEDPGAKRTPSDRQLEIAASTAAVAATRDVVVLVKQQTHYVKLRENHANRLLARRDEGVSVTELARLPAGEVESRAVVTSHESSVPIPALESRLPYPQLHLRHYQGRVRFAGSTLMFTDHTILPDSFRHHLRADPLNPLAVNVSVTFARIPPQLVPTEVLPGSYYQLDNSYPGHFGHLTTEVLAKLWGWDEAKRVIPDLKAIFAIPAHHQRDPALERRYFTAYGIPESDIVWVDRPVVLESVVAAAPMWHNNDPHYVHPGMRDVWDRLGAGLIDETAPKYERVFISRSASVKRRTCRNVGEVEDFFAARGFTVVYPELLDLSQQAGIFAQASVIAGFGGSALFNLMFARRLSTLIVLAHEAYTARNEHLFTTLLGGDVHYFWSEPDIAHPSGGWDQRAFYSDWEFDFERNRAPLDELVDTL